MLCVSFIIRSKKSEAGGESDGDDQISFVADAQRKAKNNEAWFDRSVLQPGFQSSWKTTCAPQYKMIKCNAS